MKLRIIEAGWETYTGLLGITQFENGVSVNDVPHYELNNISANLRVVEAGSGDEVGSLQNEADVQTISAVSSNLKTWAEIIAEGEKQEELTELKTEVKANPTKDWTEESLAVVADKDGIAGLRVIADPLGVKGTSISGLINAILGTQKPVVEAPVAPAAEETAEVPVVTEVPAAE